MTLEEKIDIFKIDNLPELYAMAQEQPLRYAKFKFMIDGKWQEITFDKKIDEFI